MSFCFETTVKATRKDHVCDGCRCVIMKGSSAKRWRGVTDGDFGSAIYHCDCRAAEIAYNREVLTGVYGEWGSLDECIGDGGEEWLRERFPAVAERMCGAVS